jgi:ribosome-binding protein aMBF1 (putative translation factor)
LSDRVIPNTYKKEGSETMSARKDRQELRTRAAVLIKEARRKDNISQMRLAELCGVSQPLVSSWECGKVTPNIDDLVAVEEALHIEEGTLVLSIAYPKHHNIEKPLV